MNDLARALVDRMPALTLRRSSQRAIDNARLNQPHVAASVLDLALPAAAPASAVVMSAGPSLHRQDPAADLLAVRDDHVIVAVDAALGYCLRNDLVPDFVICVDPHPTRVCRWFGDRRLSLRDEDDYFLRQELDPHLASSERARNEELMALVDRHGRSITAVLATSVSPSVTERVIESGMAIHWWNPMLDDVNNAESMTRALYRLNRMPAMVTGGNVGTAAWVFAHQILRRDPVALVGMDFGYAPGTPIEKTQYFNELRELFGDRADEAFVEIRNPDGDTWFADPAYYWYRQCFLDMVRTAPCTTVNCTEGGTLFGEGVERRTLREQLGREALDVKEGGS